MATNNLTDEQIKMALRERVVKALEILGDILSDINRLDGFETFGNVTNPKG